ncbi:uncharacterized protein PV06_02159 [Exophiala oligosperma]|uniref:Uncharacterized protein n=1 Tax=Exophiala oligosperma TaxID=215243 RepID=A0A0D2DV96_9EURO|nr:uncharacterized protein PV06_02159 [Exophiala oligosperma]KIW46490.1 hypothetical protein PV06_02159 [Exophiala oligosperma]
MWWIDSAIAVTIGLFHPFAIISLHDDGKEAHMKLQAMTTVWLLPVVSTIVASATGGIAAEALTNAGCHQHAFWTMIISCILLVTGLPIATGSFALMRLGRVAAELFPNLDNIALDKYGNVGSELDTFGTAVAMIMW